MTRVSPIKPEALGKPEPAAHDAFPVVGIGASAGGLEACRKLLDGLPVRTGMAFILVQHLEPDHDSLMVELLASHTRLKVLEAGDGMLVAPEHLYVIPPGAYLAVERGALRLSPPGARHGARLPFDFLLRSMVRSLGARAIAVILSGTGSDGSLALAEASGRPGLVIAQDPAEAGFSGMPQNAIATDAVDLVLPVSRIGEALVARGGRPGGSPAGAPAMRPEASAEALDAIIALLRGRTSHDFRPYKPGTLRRRIERRMALGAAPGGTIEDYLARLERDPDEAEALASDLLINVTRFFRDPPVFETLAETVIPDLVRGRTGDAPIRIWVAGCSSGEETYSLAMLFLEAIAAAKRPIKLQVFASDADPDAVATAREGLYPPGVAADMSAERLARFFTPEEHGLRVTSELRACVVFTVQDVLVDPPFARLDLVSCRNLLIYLEPDAQARVISLFHFALREGGVLVLGSSETVNAPPGRFEVISKSARIYRRIGRSRPGEVDFSSLSGEPGRPRVRPAGAETPRGAVALAELCRRLVIEAFAPASVLINAANECLYSLGPTDTYLRLAPGHPSQDILAMARRGVRAALKTALGEARAGQTRALVRDCSVTHEGRRLAFDVCAAPAPGDREGLILVSFVEAKGAERGAHGRGSAPEPARIEELRRELANAERERNDAIRDLERMSEEQKAVNEEALSMNEEFQAANEELVTSKEELQSLNEELTALNSQLQETLDRQRTTSDDMQNVLYSTDIATLFLDANLNIRFFTPTIRRLFSLIPGDVGRPIVDLKPIAGDDALAAEAKAVLGDHLLREREILTPAGDWFLRRILPYRAHDGGVGGVVITFADITERKRISTALETTKTEAQFANLAKSRFLAAASHDLRQPIQTISLLQGLLAKSVEDDRSKGLVARLEEALGAMSGMLNTLLDISQIEAGVVKADRTEFAVGDLFRRLRDEFAYHAQAQKLEFRVIGSSAIVESDARLLEQMVRNLLSNAFKYTRTGKVLMGCRRRGGAISIEVWDTGAGIPEGELTAIFDEFHQLENPARERSRGLGLGLSIVQRLGALLGHPVRVRSRLGAGSMFAINVPLRRTGARGSGPAPGSAGEAGAHAGAEARSVLIVEDDPEVRSLLEIMLEADGLRILSAPDGETALQRAAESARGPDLILSDFNLPGALNGVEVITRIRAERGRAIPAIILTGDITSRARTAVAESGCVQMNKPVRGPDLAGAIERLLKPAGDRPQAAPERPPRLSDRSGLVCVVDDDAPVRHALRSVLEAAGWRVRDYGSAEAFVADPEASDAACLLLDGYLPGMSGLDLLNELARRDRRLPTILITGNSDVPMAVRAMRAGAVDFIEKPVSEAELLASLERALELSRDEGKREARRNSASASLSGLTPRQREVMDRVLKGQASKIIAADLGISQRTVENHRASIMRKTGSKSLPALVRLALSAA